MQTVRRSVATAALAGVAWLIAATPAVAARPSNDPLISQQRHLRTTHVADAWRLTKGAKITVAVIDSGVELGHPDLAGNIWTNVREIPRNGVDDDRNGYVDDRNGFDFVENDDDPGDPLGHGTMVAGVLGARGNNGRGISGVAQRAQIMALRVLDARGVGTVYTISRAIRYAAAMGARIANVSLSPATNPGDLLEALEFARTRGMLVVVIAGNDGRDLGTNPLYPACAPLINVITVGATDDRGALVPFSNYGHCVDVAAPGVRVLGTARGGHYGRNTGTSLAAPQVSGTALLALARQPKLTVEQLASLLRARPRGRAAQTSPIARLDVGAVVEAVR